MASDPSSTSLDWTLRDFVPDQKVFGRYRLIRILGRGGMGIVWLARDDELDRDVALKFLPEIIVHDRGIVADLKRETKRALELTHENIIRIHDFVQDSVSACISMEYIDGDTLSNLRRDRAARIFEPDELKPWVKQLCDALDYAHNRARIIHRDLKPSNLMISKRGRLKIADFGIARSLSESVSMLTHSEGRSGTLVYMSPQQLNGDRGTHLDDIYSVGATLYELLTSKPPFYSGDISRQIHERVPPPVMQRRAELDIEGNPMPKSWEETIAACLAKDPTKRPQSVTEIAHRLLSAQADKPTPKSVRSQAKRTASFPSTVALASAVAIVAIAAGLLFGWNQHRRKLNTQKLAESEQSTVAPTTAQPPVAAPTPITPLPGTLEQTEQSPKGDIRVEYRRDMAGDPDLPGMVWLISLANESKRLLLYKHARGTQVIFSPNEQWLVVNDDHGSGQSTVQLFRRVRSDDVAFEVPPEVASHNRPLGILAWCFLWKELGNNAGSCDGGDPYHVFIHALAWQSDSSAVMVKIGRGGSESQYTSATPYECWYDVDHQKFQSITNIDVIRYEIEQAHNSRQQSPSPQQAKSITIQDGRISIGGVVVEDADAVQNLWGKPERIAYMHHGGKVDVWDSLGIRLVPATSRKPFVTFDIFFTDQDKVDTCPKGNYTGELVFNGFRVSSGTTIAALNQYLGAKALIQKEKLYGRLLIYNGEYNGTKIEIHCDLTGTIQTIFVSPGQQTQSNAEPLASPPTNTSVSAKSKKLFAGTWEGGLQWTIGKKRGASTPMRFYINDDEKSGTMLYVGTGQSPSPITNLHQTSDGALTTGALTITTKNGRTASITLVTKGVSPVASGKGTFTRQ